MICRSVARKKMKVVGAYWFVQELMTVHCLSDCFHFESVGWMLGIASGLEE